MGSTEPFTAEALDGADLLVISNAIAESTLESWTLPTPSAFGDDEIDAVEAWVRGGGALLLIDDALSEARTAARLDPLDPYYKHHVGKLLFCDGRETEAIRHLQRSMRWDRALPIARRTLVDAWARQGQPDSALEALLRAVEERDPQVLFHRCDSAFDVLVEDPRLAEVARRIGLP